MAYALIRKCCIADSSAQCVVNSLKINRNLNNLNTDNVTYHLPNEWYHVIDFLLNHISSFSALSITMAAITPNSDPQNQILEFRTNTQRICGQSGIRLSRNEIKDPDIIKTIHITKEHQSFTPLAELKPVSKTGFVVGIVTKSAAIKACRGMHSYSKQIRIRDASLSSDSYAFEVMLFDHTNDHFPVCSVGDIIKFERISIKWRSANSPFFQGTAALNDDIAIYAVIDGITGTLKHSNREEYELYDGDEEWLQLRTIMTANASNTTEITSNLTQNDSNMTEADADHEHEEKEEEEEKASSLMLNEITADDERVDLLVLVAERMFLGEAEAEVDKDKDCFDFYWVVWDGSYCKNNSELFQIYHGTESEEKYRMEVQQEGDAATMKSHFKQEENIGTKVKILVSVPDFFTMSSCLDVIEVGHWVHLTQVLVDKQRKQLVYDGKSDIRSENKFKQMHFKVRDTKIDQLTCTLFNKINVVTSVSNIRPHHQYQSYTVIRSVLDIKIPQCYYRIMGKVTRHMPNNTDEFIRYYRNDPALKIIFVLYVEDASGATIKVIFEGKEAMQFMGIKDINTLEAKQEIKRCMDIVMDDKSIVDVCLRSYKVRNKRWIAYKGFDTILIK